MQTLNVGAGRTDDEYRAAGEQRLADLRDESRGDANYFVWAAGLAALGTGLLPVRVNILVSIGAVDLLRIYGRGLVRIYPFAPYSAAAMWVAAVMALGFAARGGRRWAVVAGVVFFGGGMIAAPATFFFWGIVGPAVVFVVLAWGEEALSGVE